VGRNLIRTWAVAASLSALASGCASTTTPRPGNVKPSFTESITTSVKSGASKVGAALTPKPKAPEETSGFGTPKPSPGLHVAIAQMAERKGNLEEAETHYQKALQIDSNHLPSLLGYAHLEEGRKDYDAAVKHYQRAIKKHPKEAAPHNDLGLCYQHQGKLKEAAKSLQTAVELQPARRLYRANLAGVLVEQGKNDEALKQLIAAHGEAVGHYNLAYMLAQRPDPRPSLPYFQKALEKDPTLAPASEWIALLSPAPPRTQPPSQPWAPPTQTPAIVAQQPAPALPTARAQIEALPPTMSPPDEPTQVVAAPMVTPAPPQRQSPPQRQPALVAKADPPVVAKEPVVETMRPDGVIRATVGDGPSSGGVAAGAASSDFQFLPADRAPAQSR
jgi:Tfp pilus assembly protein PilF